MEGVLVPIHALGPASADHKTRPQSVAAAFDKTMKPNSHVRASQIGAEEQQRRSFKALEDVDNSRSFLNAAKFTTANDPKLVGCGGDWVECALLRASPFGEPVGRKCCG